MRNRYFLLAPALLLVLVFGSASAASAATARETIEVTVHNVLKLLQSPDFKNQATREAQIKKIEVEIEKTFDFQEFAMRTIGPAWKDFTPDQQTRFRDAFANLLRATYIDQLKEYNGEAVTFTGETTSTKGDKVEITSNVQLQDKSVPVSYRLIQKGSAWVVYDMIIENVSMVQNYRSQFQELLAKGNAESLIAQINQKADTTRASTNNTGK